MRRTDSDRELENQRSEDILGEKVASAVNGLMMLVSEWAVARAKHSDMITEGKHWTDEDLFRSAQRTRALEQQSKDALEAVVKAHEEALRATPTPPGIGAEQRS